MPPPPTSPPPPRAAQLALAARALTSIYDGLVNASLWITSFDRGPRGAFPPRRGFAKRKLPAQDGWPRLPPVAPKPASVRQLATTHLGHAATDGWNVVVGALELARIWALPDRGCGGEGGLCARDLARDTRMRLAVCLNVAWKFQRAYKSIFTPIFPDEASPADGPPLRSYELAHIGFYFLFADEQDAFGDWDPTNVEAVRRLYKELWTLEAELLCSVHTFPLLAENAQLEAEHRLQELFDAKLLGADRCMVLRSLVPFFVQASVHGLAAERGSTDASLYVELMAASDVRPSAGGLLCAALACVRAAGAHAAAMPALEAVFDAEEIQLAWRLLDNALRALASDADGDDARPHVRRGCYGDPGWYGYGYLTDATLRLARCATAARGA